MKGYAYNFFVFWVFFWFGTFLGPHRCYLAKSPPGFGFVNRTRDLLWDRQASYKLYLAAPDLAKRKIAHNLIFFYLFLASESIVTHKQQNEIYFSL
jgi:hypothetical protein